MVEDAVEAIGFGRFQWKLSVLTGLAWVNKYLGAMLHIGPPAAKMGPTATRITQLSLHI
jgi:hypothetical protein